MNILFLDIDGVLNIPINTHSHNGLPLQEIFVERLNKIVEKVNPFLVVSSTWRKGKSVEKLRELFEERGFVHKKRIIGKTPVLNNKERSEEIKKWIKQNDVEKFAVLDDRRLDINNFFRTNPHEGLTEEVVNDIINYFKNE